MSVINKFCLQVNLNIMDQTGLNGYVRYNESNNRVEIVSREIVIFDTTIENVFKAGVQTYAEAAKNLLKAFEKGYRFGANTIILGFNAIVEEL